MTDATTPPAQKSSGGLNKEGFWRTLVFKKGKNVQSFFFLAWNLHIFYDKFT
jgi:hypothetical protein